LRARPGYAVGGLTVRSGLHIDGLSLTYMRINGGGLDPQRSYESDWVGNRTGGSEKTVSGNGAPIVGVFGNSDEQRVLALGLIAVKTPAMTEQPPAEPRPRKSKALPPNAPPPEDAPAEPVQADLPP